MELKEEISASHQINLSIKDTTMFKKIALAAALIAGTASVAFAEDGSSSFPQNIYSPYARQSAAPTLANRNVALSGQVIVRDAQAAGYDHASSPYAGGGF
jgi:hypothetical protein